MCLVHADEIRKTQRWKNRNLQATWESWRGKIGQNILSILTFDNGTQRFQINLQWCGLQVCQGTHQKLQHSAKPGLKINITFPLEWTLRISKVPISFGLSLLLGVLSYFKTFWPICVFCWCKAIHHWPIFLDMQRLCAMCHSEKRNTEKNVVGENMSSKHSLQHGSNCRVQGIHSSGQGIIYKKSVLATQQKKVSIWLYMAFVI